MKFKINFFLFIFILFILNVRVIKAQISAPGSSSSAITAYEVFPENDSIFIFCTDDETAQAAVLEVQTTLQGTKTFLWEKYNPQSGNFEFHLSESKEIQQSSIPLLSDGGYRVTVSQGENSEVYRAWVFNNWMSATAGITESTCESLSMEGAFTSSEMFYYDLSSNNQIEFAKDIRVEWKQNDQILATPYIFNPPARDTEYLFRVYDQFGCEATATVLYESIVTNALFSVDFGEQNPGELEAPLTVRFINESENGDANQYEWFFYRDLDEIKEESANSQIPVDSIQVVAFDENPTYTYENTGTYMVKLVSKHVSEFHTCTDTFYMPEFIIIEPSFIEAPNVFTPNGDGINDLFVVKFRSMQSIKIQIFNRWGNRIHFWESNDVRGFGDSFSATVWDGSIGGRKASPGVYYYVVEGRGRDDTNRRANGFVHLFREKD